MPLTFPVCSHVVRTLLREGYRVRGTVRSDSKGDYLEKLFRNEGKFDYVIVEDIIKVKDHLLPLSPYLLCLN